MIPSFVDAGCISECENGGPGETPSIKNHESSSLFVDPICRNGESDLCEKWADVWTHEYTLYRFN